MVIVGNRKFSKYRDVFVITCVTMHGDADFDLHRTLDIPKDETGHVNLILATLHNMRSNAGNLYSIIDHIEIDTDTYCEVQDMLSDLIPVDRVSYSDTSHLKSFDVTYYDEFGDTYTVIWANDNEDN